MDSDEILMDEPFERDESAVERWERLAGRDRIRGWDEETPVLERWERLKDVAVLPIWAKDAIRFRSDERWPFKERAFNGRGGGFGVYVVPQSAVNGSMLDLRLGHGWYAAPNDAPCAFGLDGDDGFFALRAFLEECFDPNLPANKMVLDNPGEGRSDERCFDYYGRNFYSIEAVRVLAADARDAARSLRDVDEKWQHGIRAGKLPAVPASGMFFCGFTALALEPFRRSRYAPSFGELAWFFDELANKLEPIAKLDASEYLINVVGP